jgi:hypothetical protein
MPASIPSDDHLRRQAVLELRLEGNVNPSIEQLSTRIEQISARYDHLTGKMKDAQAAFDKQRAALNTLNSTFQNITGTIARAGSVFGATSLGFSSAIQNLNNYNIQLRSTASQFVKYGQGLTETKNKVEQLSEAFQFTRQQTMELMSTFESGFDNANLNAMPGMFEKIADSVGSSKEAMASMLQSLQGIAGKSMQFSQILMSAFDGTRSNLGKSVKDITAAGFAMLAGGKISVSEAKKLDEFVNGGSATSKEDSIQKKMLDEQMKFFRSMNKLFEDISLNIGKQLMPAIKFIGDVIISIKNYIVPIVSWIGIIGGTLLSLASTMVAIKGLNLGAGLVSGAVKTLLGLGGATVGGAGSASLAGGGLLAGLGGLVGGKVALASGGALAGLAGGNLIARAAGIGVYGWADSINATADGIDPSRGRDERQRLLLEKSKLQSKMDAKRVAGPWWGMGLIQGKDSDIDLRQINNYNTQLKILAEQEEEHKKIEEAEKKKLAPIAKYAVELAQINEILDKQNSRLQSQVQYMENISQLSGMSRLGGNAGVVQEEIGSTRDQLNAQRSLNEIAIRTTYANMQRANQQLKDLSISSPGTASEAMRKYEEITKMGIDDPERKKAEQEFARNYGIQIDGETRLKELKSENLSIQIKLNKLPVEAIKIKDQALEQSRMETSLLESQMNLRNALGFGLRDTVQGQMQVVTSLTQQKELMKGQLLDLQKAEQMAKKDDADRMASIMTDPSVSIAEKMIKINDIKEEAQRREFNNRNEILRKENEIIQATQKQAELTKTLREGYISAIAAMNNGAGAFTRIVISQDQKLGNLVFSSPDRIRALRAGSELEGRRESGRFGAGYLVEGSAGAAERATLAQYGNFNSDIVSGAKAVMNYQNNIGNNNSGFMSNMANNIYGTAQVFEEAKNLFTDSVSGLKTYGKDMANSVEKGLTAESSKIVDAIVNAFIQITKTASDETLKTLKRG